MPCHRFCHALPCPVQIFAMHCHATSPILPCAVMPRLHFRHAPPCNVFKFAMRCRALPCIAMHCHALPHVIKVQSYKTVTRNENKRKNGTRFCFLDASLLILSWVREDACKIKIDYYLLRFFRFHALFRLSCIYHQGLFRALVFYLLNSSFRSMVGDYA